MSRNDELTLTIIRDLLARNGWSRVVPILAREALLYKGGSPAIRNHWDDVHRKLIELVAILAVIEGSEAEVRKNSQA